MKKQTIGWIAVFAVILVAAGIVFLSVYQNQTTSIGPLGSTHEHIDFKVYVNGEALDFSLPKYQVRSQYVHVENGDGDVIHKHATGVTMGFFLETLGIRFDSSCLVPDTGDEFCNNGKTLKFYVNGMTNDEFGNYEFHDRDRILISYGDEGPDEIHEQINSITNKAASARG